MKASEDRRTGDGARTGRFVYGFSDNLDGADVPAPCGGKGLGSCSPCRVPGARLAAQAALEG